MESWQLKRYIYIIYKYRMKINPNKKNESYSRACGLAGNLHARDIFEDGD